MWICSLNEKLNELCIWSGHYEINMFFLDLDYVYALAKIVSTQRKAKLDA